MNFKILTLSLIVSTSLFSAEPIGFGDPVTFGTQVNSLPKEKEKIVKQRDFSVEESSLIRHKQIISFIQTGDLKKALFEADLYYGDTLNLKKEGTELAVALITIGEVTKTFGDYQKALKFHEKAFLELEKIRKQYPLDYALGAKYIADTMLLAGFADKAKDYALEAEKTLQFNFSRRDILFGDIHYLLAKIYNDQEQFREANGKIRDAEDIYKVFHGSSSYEMALLSFEKAKGSMVAGNYKDCLVLLNSTENVLNETFIQKYPNHQIFGEILNLKGLSYIGEFKFENAITEYNKSLDFYSKLFEPNNEKIASILANKALAEKNLLNHNVAIEDYKKAAEIFINKKGENTAELIDIYQNLGNIYLTNKEYDLAIDYTKKALEINIYNYSRFHTTTKIINSNLDFIMKQKNSDWQQNN